MITIVGTFLKTTSVLDVAKGEGWDIPVPYDLVKFGADRQVEADFADLDSNAIFGEMRDKLAKDLIARLYCAVFYLAQKASWSGKSEAAGEEPITPQNALEKIRKIRGQIADFKGYARKLEEQMEADFPEWGWQHISGFIVIWENQLDDYLKILEQDLKKVQTDYPKKD